MKKLILFILMIFCWIIWVSHWAFIFWLKWWSYLSKNYDKVKNLDKYFQDKLKQEIEANKKLYNTWKRYGLLKEYWILKEFSKINDVLVSILDISKYSDYNLDFFYEKEDDGKLKTIPLINWKKINHLDRYNKLYNSWIIENKDKKGFWIRWNISNDWKHVFYIVSWYEYNIYEYNKYFNIVWCYIDDNKIDCNSFVPDIKDNVNLDLKFENKFFNNEKHIENYYNEKQKYSYFWKTAWN